MIENATTLLALDLAVILICNGLVSFILKHKSKPHSNAGRLSVYLTANVVSILGLLFCANDIVYQNKFSSIIKNSESIDSVSIKLSGGRYDKEEFSRTNEIYDSNQIQQCVSKLSSLYLFGLSNDPEVQYSSVVPYFTIEVCHLDGKSTEVYIEADNIIHIVDDEKAFRYKWGMSRMSLKLD